MTEDELKDWLKELLDRLIERTYLDRQDLSGRALKIERLRQDAATRWYAEAQAALESILPREHAILQSWSRATAPLAQVSHFVTYLEHYEAAHGVLQAASALLRDGRLRSLLDGVRAETVAEVLDQAGVLRRANHLPAAAVLAGGALETHLHNLCVGRGLTWNGSGSISKYDGSISKARNDGVCTVYDGTTSKQVTAWGGLRNDAAHNPTTFSASSDEVQRMIDGVRDFIRQTK